MNNTTNELNELYNAGVSEALAKRAHEANSYSDYKEGSATAEYQQCVDNAKKIADHQKNNVDSMHHEKIESLLIKYASRLAKNMNDRFSIDARVPSILITGGSNFPVRKKEKQNDARDKNMKEWQEINDLLDKIRSVGKGGISSDDPEAIKKLEMKLANLEKSQKVMKEVNAYYRKNKTLDGCPSLSNDSVNELKKEMDSTWHTSPKPFETFMLSNNNAEIKRIKSRIEALKNKSEQHFEGWEFDGGKVEVNEETNRLCIYFDGKPDEAVRTKLKSNGFRWAPSVGAWQRQYTQNAIYSIKRIPEVMEMVQNEI